MISELYPPEVIGGAEKYVQTISERLVEKGHEVTVLTTGNSKEYDHIYSSEQMNGVQVDRISPLNMYSPIEHPDRSSWKKPIQHFIDLWNPHTYMLTRQRLRDINPDIVHIHNFSGLSPSVFRASSSYPVCHTLHDYSLIHILPDMYIAGETRELSSLMAPYRIWNKHYVEPYVDIVTAPSNYLLDKHHSKGIFKETKSKTLRLGINPPEETENKEPDSEVFRLLFVGNISEKKGALTLVEIFEFIDEENIRLDIVGKGDKLSTLKSNASRYSNVHVHGFVSEGKLERFYRNASCTIVPSKWHDNSPMVIYESYSYATPVIGANIGGIPELIEPAVTGFLFEPNNSDDLVETIRKATRTVDRSMFKSAAEKSREFNLDSHIEELTEIYQNL